ncbi:type III secretion protein [Caballeronia mineralivorans]|jgi:type III secretion system HrpB7-like protein|uniref:type III secretion protein n=1 Tax=Caballeronia mineralivorans TaxID=2010198 RepID=UPI0023F548ED|nr:type III secretion protein [Caballeronia mineralivorans]MDB5787001.1 type secretion protein [Caballeronia mineralivorans]MEA3098932.1 hypothetical protein [Caballeronia mineralivorans]
MNQAGRRIAALRRARSRRERMEADLRAVLEARRREHAELQARAGEAEASVARLDTIARDHRERIAGMMTGSEPFSIDIFEACRRYLEIVDAQLGEAQAALQACVDAVAAKAGEMAAARCAIALNRGRIDVCRDRAKQLEKSLDQIAADAEDEAAEELALARRAHV